MAFFFLTEEKIPLAYCRFVADCVIIRKQGEKTFVANTQKDATMNLTGNEDYTMVMNGCSARRAPVDGVGEKKASAQPKMEDTSPKKTDAARKSREKPEPQKAKKSNSQGSARGRQVGKILLALFVDILFGGIFWGGVAPQILICMVLCTVSGCFLGTLRREQFCLLRRKLLVCLAVSPMRGNSQCLNGTVGFFVCYRVCGGDFQHDGRLLGGQNRLTSATLATCKNE